MQKARPFGRAFCMERGIGQEKARMRKQTGKGPPAKA